MLESDMVEIGVAFLRQQKQYHIVKQEVPFLSRCIDVVLLDQEDKVISIEFKVSKWRHAIEQAKNHKLGADKAYICLPERKLSDPLSTAIKEAGIGLYFFSTTSTAVIYEAIPAPEANGNVPFFRKMLLESVSKISE